MKEKWLPIEGTNNLYYVSNKGRVKSFKMNKLNGHLMTQYVNKHGYKFVNIEIDGFRKSRVVHQLVAKTFIKNPNNYPIINHIDGNKQNNTTDNLEWCTYSYNIQHAYNTGLQPKRKPTVHKKQVKQYTLDGVYITTWDSSVSAAKALNKDPSGINRACQSHTHKSYGYLWFR